MLENIAEPHDLLYPRKEAARYLTELGLETVPQTRTVKSRNTHLLHVPAADVLRVLTERPPGIIGLAVPGMPIGSPGMEQPGAAREPFDVFAFRTNGARSVFARHA